MTALVKTPEAEEFATPSPDGRRVAFVRKNDLYVVEVSTRRETRLTSDGSDTLLNGRLDWVYEEELASRSGKAFEWSPDSRAIAFLQLDQARVQTFPIVDFLPVRNEVSWQRYPKSGTPNAVVRLGVVALESDGTAAPARLVAFQPDDTYVLPQISWTRDSQKVAFQQMNRAQNELELKLLPVPGGAREPLGTPQTVLHERSKTWVNTFEPPIFLKDNRRFLWLSERDGFAHVYVCEMSGSCRAVTQGPWVVDAQVSFASAAPPLHAGRAQRLPLLHRDREGPARAAPVPHAPRRHRATAADARGRHAPHLRLARRALLRRQLVRRGDADEGVGGQPGRQQALRARGERAAAAARLRARPAWSGRRSPRRTARGCTVRW